ncbi:putative alpha-E superfamily protein [Palleronia aestuarii]|uniref:Putative alpha-E superfamily protein n=1 Tax=Palleronia aestuarii TaxID=568105 RepID=A0A2W7NXW7_9RHOB|nr:alpha-E domain-containing protein [Palleronia aestuarii]PZX16042.1 putative alpha-E superfamily protein [Palleronia aestuarii]
MLSRTAENLYWTARYIERAETNARLLEVGARNALLPDTSGGNRNEWESVLLASGTKSAFDAKYGDAVERNVETHLFFDRDNPSSVASCLSAARENGRIVRTALTTQVWEALNSAFAEVGDIARQERSSLSTTDLIEWTLKTTALIRGAGLATQLRNDGYDFTNIGHFLERADSTARLLDVKYFVLLPDVGFVGSGLDNYQWRTILRAMNASRAFNWVYGGDVTASKIVDFLVLNRQAPRSLVSSADGALHHIERLARAYGRETEAQTKARALVARLDRIGTEEIFDIGLHQFLRSVIGEVSDLGLAVHATYLSGESR